MNYQSRWAYILDTSIVIELVLIKHWLEVVNLLFDRLTGCQFVIPAAQLSILRGQLSLIHQADRVDLKKDDQVDDADFGASDVPRLRQVVVKFLKDQIEEFD